MGDCWIVLHHNDSLFEKEPNDIESPVKLIMALLPFCLIFYKGINDSQMYLFLSPIFFKEKNLRKKLYLF